MAINCNRTLSCISLFEYFLLVEPPLKRVPIPNTKTTATANIRTIAKTFINISETIRSIYYINLKKKIKLYIYDILSRYKTYKTRL